MDGDGDIAQDMAAPGQGPAQGQTFVNVVKPMVEGVVHACPCCKEQTLSRRGAGEKCMLCYWFDDGQDDHDADVIRGTLNGDISLAKARENFVALGICRPEMAPEQFDLPTAALPPALLLPPPRKVWPLVLTGLAVLAALVVGGLWWQPWAPPAAPPLPPAAPPRGQETPEQTVGKFLWALARGYHRPFRECLTGPARAIERMERMFEASLVWDKFRSAVESAYGYPAWEGAVQAAGVRILSRHWYCRRGDYAQLHVESAQDDRAVVSVRFLALGTTGQVFLEQADGIWRIDASRPVLVGDERDLRAAGRAIERLPGLRAKVEKRGFPAEGMQEELRAIFADVAYLDGLARTGARPRAGGENPCVSVGVVPAASAADEAAYLVDGRTMTLEGLADLLADLVGRQGRLDVQIRFDSRYPLGPAQRAEDVCRAVGTGQVSLRPMQAQPTTAPATGPQGAP